MIHNQPAINVFPDPASNFVTLDYRSSQTGDKIYVKIADVLGNCIKTFELSGTGQILKNIDVSGLETGLYLITVVDNDAVVTTKFIKQ